MKVLVVCSNYPLSPNSITTPIVSTLVEELIARPDVDVSVVAPRADGVPGDVVVNGVNVTVVRYLPRKMERLFGYGSVMNHLKSRPWLWWQVPFYVVGLALTVRKVTRGGDIDLVHSHWLLPQGAVVAMVLHGRFPHIATVHGGDVFRGTSRIRNGIRRFAINRTSLVTVNGTPTEQLVRTLAPSAEVVMVRQGVRARRTEPQRSSSAGERAVSIGFVGRLVEEKGVFDLIEAIAVLLERDRDVRLEIVGDGDARAAAELLAHDRGVAERVTFTGWLDPRAVQLRLLDFDIVACPSKRSADGWVEAQGLVVAEAMLAGAAVVASRSGGIPDYVEDRVNGILFEEGDVGGLADALEVLLDDRRTLDCIRANGQEWARNNAVISNVADEYVRLYYKCLNR